MPARGSRGIVVGAAVAAVLAIAAMGVYGFSRGPSAPSRLADWYVGSWRVSGPMVGVSQGQLVDRPNAPPGTVVIEDAGQNGRLSVTMKGFPGVVAAPSQTRLDQFKLNYATRDTDEQTTAWAFVLGSDGKAAVAAFDPTTGRYTVNIPLVRE